VHRFRRPMLYPTELQARQGFTIHRLGSERARVEFGSNSFQWVWSGQDAPPPPSDGPAPAIQHPRRRGGAWRAGSAGHGVKNTRLLVLERATRDLVRLRAPRMR